jgi:hypothetical protein
MKSLANSTTCGGWIKPSLKKSLFMWHKQVKQQPLEKDKIVIYMYIILPITSVG